MPSPFPGMNPYLERSTCWEDFHNDYLVRMRAALVAKVGPKYIVKTEVRLLLHELSANDRFFGIADVGVASRTRPVADSGVGTLVDGPVELTFPAVEEEKQTFLEILDRDEKRLVTVIELLSPSNKTPGPDRDAYLVKRKRIVKSTAHFVEIDLRRGGIKPEPPELPSSDYYALVSRYERRPRFGVWPIGIHEPLPRLPIPLNAPDADIEIDLMDVLHRTYDGAGYERYIYESDPEPPLPPADAKWAKAIIAPILTASK